MISVVTITFNNFEDLRQTVESVLEGRLRGHAYPLEWIVVNGGTCARTQAYLHAVSARIQEGDATSTLRLKLIQEPDRGIADAFNKGIAAATGIGVMFLNSGDLLLEPTYPSDAGAFLRQHPEVGLVHGNVTFADRLSGDMLMRPSGLSLGRGMPYWHQTMVVRRELFGGDQLGAFNLTYRIAMDYDFACRLHKHGVRAHYHDAGPVVRMDGGGISATQEGRSIRECWQALSAHRLLTVENCLGIGLRFSLYRMRIGMVRLGLAPLLAELKKLKHRA